MPAEQAKNMPKTPQTPQLLTPSESRGVDSTATKDQVKHVVLMLVRNFSPARACPLA